MRKQFLLLILLLGVSCKVFAQTEATTKDGIDVLLFDDGTWKAKPNANSIDTLDLSCDALIKTTFDEISGKSSTDYANPLMISENGTDGFLINGALWKEYKVINLFFVVYGGGSCVDDKARINILFTDGSRMEMYNDVDFNCDQIFSLNFLGMSGKKKQLQSLMTKNLDKVRISTSDGKSVSQIFDKSQSDKFRESIKCLYNIL